MKTSGKPLAYAGRRYKPRKVMRNIYLLFLAILSINTFASDSGSNINSCENAPKEAITNLPAPYSSWIAINCDGIRKAHFAGAQKGYEWSGSKSKNDYKFNAYGPISPKVSTLEKNIYEPHKYHFIKTVPSIMTSQQAPGVNQLLPPSAGKYEDIHQLDLNTNTKVIYSLFIFLKDSTPEWVVACVNFNCQKRATIKITKVESKIGL